MSAGIDRDTRGRGVPRTLAVEAAEPVLDSPPAAIANLLQDDEIILLMLQPSLWFIPLTSAVSALVIACLALTASWISHLPAVPWSERQALSLGTIAIVVRLVWQTIEWANRSYVLTDRRVLRRRGVIRVSVVEAPLRNVQNTTVVVLARDRLLGIGSIGIATLGSDSFNLWWSSIRRPFDAHRTLVEAIERYGRHDGRRGPTG